MTGLSLLLVTGAAENDGDSWRAAELAYAAVWAWVQYRSPAWKDDAKCRRILGERSLGRGFVHHLSSPFPFLKWPVEKILDGVGLKASTATALIPMLLIAFVLRIPAWASTRESSVFGRAQTIYNDVVTGQAVKPTAEPPPALASGLPTAEAVPTEPAVATQNASDCTDEAAAETFADGTPKAVSRRLNDAWLKVGGSDQVGCPQPPVKRGAVWVSALSGIPGDESVIAIGNETFAAIVHHDFIAIVKSHLLRVGRLSTRLSWGLGNIQFLYFDDGSCTLLSRYNHDAGIELPENVLIQLGADTLKYGAFPRVTQISGNDSLQYKIEWYAPSSSGNGAQLVATTRSSGADSRSPQAGDDALACGTAQTQLETEAVTLKGSVDGSGPVMAPAPPAAEPSR